MFGCLVTVAMTGLSSLGSMCHGAGRQGMCTPYPLTLSLTHTHTHTHARTHAHTHTHTQAGGRTPSTVSTLQNLACCVPQTP